MKSIALAFLLFLNTMVHAQNSFTHKQLTFERVANAFHEKWPALNTDLISKYKSGKYLMLINAYKAEGKLEVWIKNADDRRYQLFKTYDFCAKSGTLGPKLFEGDKQTPEGFYQINVLNPMSTYYLSLGINYPNAVDYQRTGKDRSPGSDIYIHGNCVTVGCIPLTDDKIKEVYLLAMFATDLDKQTIPVNIYPFRMTESNFEKYGALFPQQVDFWKNMQMGYRLFERKKIMPSIEAFNGKYLVY